MIDWDNNKTLGKSMLDFIGKTPMVKLRRIPLNSGLSNQILAKIDFLNPTGSLKDRIYYKMITDAIETKELKHGMKILEASTGNSGIACAFVGNLLGFRTTIVMPEGMSEERKKMMRAFGAKIILTPGGESDVDLCIEKIKELKKENSGKYWQPSQFSNSKNIDAHYQTTGPEIWEQTDGKIDCFVASQGTGGTLTGIGRFLKEQDPNIAIYAVEPAEAPLLSKQKWGSHKIEGIGDGFVPTNLDLSLLKGIVTTTSKQSIEMSKKLALEEGIFCGISSGCNVAGVIKVARRHPEFRRIVTIINDSGQRYFSTELFDEFKQIIIPERNHVLDDFTRSQLDEYKSKWEIIE